MRSTSIKPVLTVIEGPTAVGNSALADVGSEIVLGCQFNEVFFEVTNGSSSVALQDFAILVKTDSGASFHIYLSGATWAVPPSILPYCEAALATLAAATAASARVDIGPVYSVKFQAQAASATVATTVRATFGVK